MASFTAVFGVSDKSILLFRSRLAFVIGDVVCPSANHVDMDRRSYVWPSTARTGFSIIDKEMGHNKSIGISLSILLAAAFP
jgi:hypothetical protein